MDYVFPLALLFFFVVLIGGAYYLDFKTDLKEFKFSIKAAAFGLKQYLFSINWWCNYFCYFGVDIQLVLILEVDNA